MSEAAMHWWAELATIVTSLSVLILLLSFVSNIRYQRLQSLIYLHQYLSQNDFSVARRAVRTILQKKPYCEWTEEDKLHANRVCASYDQAGILITGGIIDTRSAKVILKSSWGESICHQYEILATYLDDTQTPAGTGREFFRHFGDLYDLAWDYHRKGRRRRSTG
ncbi:MAG: hypothetical protein ACLPKB_31145 [Xanthobacteraceae bacterium]